MQKLVIKKQFMGVKPCEIEMNRFLLLIGEQASGKSTISKLIYFFQTLPDAVFEKIHSNNYSEEDTEIYIIDSIIKDKFEEIFGPARLQKSFFNFEFFYIISI